MTAFPPIVSESTVLAGPDKEGSELRWIVRRVDGTTATVGMLVPELATDVAVRRRWVSDVLRVQAVQAPGLQPVLAVGPQPNPADAAAAPPWRVCGHQADVETLDAWLDRRAPVPVDEAADVIAQLATIVHAIHAHGIVLRDLHPRRVTIDSEGTVGVSDIGLARVDVLSSRTAASLILEGSAYAAPEQFARHTVDQRSDIYGLGVLLFRALSGVLPYGEEPAILRAPGPPPSVRRLRADVSPALDAFVARCIHDEPTERPQSASTVARVLAGDSAGADAPTASVPCQHCERPLRPGQRLCVHCGREAIRFVHAPPDQDAPVSLMLTKVGEDADARAKLHTLLNQVGEGSPPALNFLVGDQRMYSKTERANLITLPVPLFGDLDRATATTLAAQLAGADGIATRVSTTKKPAGGKLTTGLGAAAAMLAVFTAAMVANGALAGIVVGAVSTLAAIVVLLVVTQQRKKRPKPPLMRLRAAPAALPASDPSVARLAELLQDNPPDDIRDQVGSLALAVQRLIDHRARNLAEAAEIDAVTEPVARLVELVRAQVLRVRTIDAELATLDEATLVRALAAAEARTAQTLQSRADTDAAGASVSETPLAGLDRLRELEDARAAAFHRLLEAATLMRRAVDLGVSVHDEGAAQEREVTAALVLLSDDDPPA